MNPCSVAGCDVRTKAKGLCLRHYQRMRIHGDVGATLGHDVDLSADRVCLACGADISGKRSNAVYCNRPCKARGPRLYPERSTLRVPEGGLPARGTPERAERDRAVARERYAQDPTRKKNAALAYYERNQEARAQYARDWRLENPHRRRTQHDRRHLKIVGNPGYCPFGRQEWERLLRRHDYCCAYCGIRPDRLQQDHVVPIARGGRHAIANILPACTTCNARKNDLLLMEWKLRLRKGGDFNPIPNDRGDRRPGPELHRARLAAR